MTLDFISYSIFTIALLLSIFLDLVVFSKSEKEINFGSAVKQYLFWVFIALCYGIYLYKAYDKQISLNYFAAYITEMSLSVDNIFVFVLIFSSLNIEKKYVGRVLTIGILMAIVLRILFIAVGIAIINQFEWVMYIFAALLIYTGVKLFFGEHEEDEKVQEGKVYKLIRKYLRYTDEHHDGKFTITKNGKVFFTKLSLVILLIGFSDILFAIDSIPAVIGITKNSLVVFSSNIFAIMGLRSLYFILQKAKDKFDYLQQGISVVLVFIGIKMFLEYFHIHIPIGISLLVILVCIGASILFSYFYDKKHSSTLEK